MRRAAPQTRVKACHPRGHGSCTLPFSLFSTSTTLSRPCRAAPRLRRTVGCTKCCVLATACCFSGAHARRICPFSPLPQATAPLSTAATRTAPLSPLPTTSLRCVPGTGCLWGQGQNRQRSRNAQGRYFFVPCPLQVNGTTIQQAVSKFWNSDENTPAAVRWLCDLWGVPVVVARMLLLLSAPPLPADACCVAQLSCSTPMQSNTYLPCYYNQDKTPYACNPTCG